MNTNRGIKNSYRAHRGSRRPHALAEETVISMCSAVRPWRDRLDDRAR
ncbi:hypothetical protein SAMN04487905_101149 [Actinopolyspora xinjiangensis]|uniref:Uncharacterized protein n=1 Tax=Actinopolyspora xinjiangensis TaxID=405564 RepID=A0A1H0NK61_9ACTN|nr:hypothetical protein SAMN04487905_101149 [Actinopolyspora xinjiangensis]